MWAVFDILISGVQTDHGEKKAGKNKRKLKRTKSVDPGSHEKRCMYYVPAGDKTSHLQKFIPVS